MTPFEITNQAVKDVADNNPEHYKTIYAFAEKWVKTQMKPFTADDLKQAYFDAGNPAPSQPAVFGAPFRKLSKNKLIFDTERTKKSENPQAHQRPLRLWISLEYRLKQQSNASKSNHTIDMFLD